VVTTVDDFAAGFVLHGVGLKVDFEVGGGLAALLEVFGETLVELEVGAAFGRVRGLGAGLLAQADETLALRLAPLWLQRVQVEPRNVYVLALNQERGLLARGLLVD